MARTAAVRKLSTDDVTVPAPKATAQDLEDLKLAAMAPMPTDHLGDPNTEDGALLSDLIAKRGRRVKNVTPMPGAELPAPRPSKAKAKAPAKAKPKVVVARVPAQRVEDLLKECSMSKTQLGLATKKSPSLVSEWVGKGRGHLMAETEWKAVEAAARKFAKGNK